MDQMVNPELMHVLVYQKKDIILGRDIMIHLSHGHAASRSDLANRSSIEAFSEEDSACSLNDLVLLFYRCEGFFRGAGNRILGEGFLRLFQLET